MNNEKFLFNLKSEFKDPKTRLARGCILIPKSPVDLDSTIRAAVETEDDEDTLGCRGTFPLLEANGWTVSPLVSFCWQSLGPMVWQAGLYDLTHETGVTFAVFEWDLEPAQQVIAQITPTPGVYVHKKLFEALINRNGEAFGLGIFGSLPSNTHNQAENLIPEDTVRQCYWNWMKWGEKAMDADWWGLAEEISARARSPIHYPLELLKGFAGINPTEWLEEHLRQNDRLTVRAKRAIFDAYWKQSYGPY
jgi:hypothetical protein